MDIIQQFTELVSIDSPSGEEHLVREYVIGWAKQHGFLYTEDAHGNLIISTNEEKPAKVFFSGHMDTVEPGRGIICVEKDGFLISSGKTILGADNKASLAGILDAIGNYPKDKLPSIELVFTSREETVMDAQYLTRDSITAPFGYIFDAPFAFGGIIQGSPYIIDFICTIQGKSAHASTPLEAKSVLPVLKDILEKIPSGPINSDVSKGTVNLGVISAGTGVNTVAGNLEIKGEIRSFDQEIFLQQKEKLQTVFDQLQTDYPDYSFHFVFMNYAAGYTHDLSSLPIALAQKAIASIGRNPKYIKPQSVSDANHFNVLGIPTVTIAEGTQYAHTVDERILIEDLKDISRLVVSIVQGV